METPKRETTKFIITCKQHIDLTLEEIKKFTHIGTISFGYDGISIQYDILYDIDGFNQFIKSLNFFNKILDIEENQKKEYIKILFSTLDKIKVEIENYRVENCNIFSANTHFLEIMKKNVSSNQLFELLSIIIPDMKTDKIWMYFIYILIYSNINSDKSLFFSIYASSSIEEQKRIKTFFKEIKKICNLCKQPSKLLCSKCKQVYYCSTECQHSQWHEHKKLCKPN